jgi:hypothetical protein
MNNDKVIELLVRAKRDDIHSSADEAGSPWMSSDTLEALKAFYEGERNAGVARLVNGEREIVEWKASREATTSLTMPLAVYVLEYHHPDDVGVYPGERPN